MRGDTRLVGLTGGKGLYSLYQDAGTRDTYDKNGGVYRGETREVGWNTAPFGFSYGEKGRLEEN